MKVTLEAVARAIDGTVVGDGSVEITGVAGIREAREGDLTFLANPRYEPYLELTQASAVIVSENHRNIGKPLIQNPNPYLAFLKAVRFFAGDAERPCSGIHPTAVIAPDAVVAEDASIGPHAVIEPGAKIGSRSIVQAGCYVGARVQLGGGVVQRKEALHIVRLGHVSENSGLH